MSNIVRGALSVIVVGAFTFPATAASADEYVSFQSPSKKIACGYYSDGSYAAVRCDIGSDYYLGKAPKRPKDCEFDWAPTATVDNKGYIETYGCIADTVFDPSARVIPYGSKFVRGGFVCESLTSGMRCTRNGKGFLMSRRSIKRV